jgi:hypothetical protein
MSLLICSNTQDEYASQELNNLGVKINTGTPIQASNFFSNHIKDPIRIPPNSEVAVQSVKIHRNPLNDIKAGNLFHIYLGLGITDADGVGTYKQSATLNIPVPVSVPPGTYTQQGFRIALQDAINKNINHPVYWNKLVITDKLSGGANWIGNTFTYSAHVKAGATNYADKMINWQGWDSRTTEAEGTDFSIVNAGSTTTYKRLKADGNSIEATAINTDCPMDLTNGSIDIDLFWGDGTHPGRMGTQGCSFFLTRPKLYDQNMPFFNDQFINRNDNSVNLFLDDIVNYGDYRIDWLETSQHAALDFRLTLSHAVWDNDTNATVMKEIQYWNEYPAGDKGANNPIDVQIKASDIVDNVANVAASKGYLGVFYMNFMGSGIRLYMRYWTYKAPADPGTFSWVLICDTTDGDDPTNNRALTEYCWSPINQNKEALYFGCSAQVEDHEIEIKQIKWNDTLRTSATVPYLYGTSSIPGSSFWSQCRWGDGDGGSKLFNSQLAKLVERRANNTGVNGLGITWTDLDASSEVPALSRAMVVNKPQRTAGETKGLYFPCRGSNLGSTLGFPDMHAIGSLQFGDTKKFSDVAQADPAAKWIVASNHVPTWATHSAFVKCPSLTMQSFNFCKSIPSQILYHIPRFSNDGADSGNMFFEVAEKTYIKLRNADWIHLNQIDLQIVDKNEQLVRDLTGDTTIVLHIR